MEVMQATYDRLINEGLQKGRQEGLQEGLQEGRQEGCRDIALSLLKKGVDPKVIIESTGLSEKELEDLKNQ